MALTKRQEQILALIVDSYISSGGPIGSGAISGELAVSSATVRNEMAILTDRGYIEQPHTSAGRVPSERGYRYYVDNLIGIPDAGEDMHFEAQGFFEGLSGSHDEILSAVAAKLSELSGCTAVVTTPYDERATVSAARLMPLGKRSAMVAVIMSTGVIKSKICRLTDELGMDDARLFYTIANAFFTGRGLSGLTIANLQTTVAALGEKLFALAPLIIAVDELARESFRRSAIVGGMSALTKGNYNTDIGALSAYLRNPDRLAAAFCSFKDDMTVRIGHENRDRELAGSSVIISKYKVGGQNVGSVGIIGPVRMDYARLIPCVRLFSISLNDVFSDTEASLQ